MPGRRRFTLAMGLPLVLAISGFALLSCESGLLAPTDPGAVQVLVTEESGTPIGDVGVRVSAVNRSGGTHYVGAKTRSDGRITISGIPAGQRVVEVTPPREYMAGTDPLSREVEVVKGRTISVTFRLRRRAGDS